MASLCTLRIYIIKMIHFILHIDQYLAGIINQYHGLSYLILFAFIFVETGLVVTPFIPGDSLLFATGALVAGGKTGLNIWLMGAILIVAAVGGNTVNYFVGRLTGPKVFKPGNKILKLEYYTRTQAFFTRYGGKAIILSRFLPVVRTIAPFVAGIGRMPFLRYTVYNIIGGTAWISAFLALGYVLGNIPVVRHNFAIVVLAIILVSVVPAVYAAVANKKAG